MSEVEGALKALRSRLAAARSPEELSSCLAAIVAQINDDRPETDEAAALVAASLRAGLVGPPALLKILGPSREAVSGSARVLLDGLLALCGDSSGAAALKTALSPERAAIYDGLSLDRLLTAIAWLRDESFVKAAKALKKKLEAGQVARRAVGTLQRLTDFIEAQRKVTRAQIQQLDDLWVSLPDGDEVKQRALRELGVSEVGQLNQGEARILGERLRQRAARDNADGITLKQLAYIRGLVKRLGLGEEAVAVIAEEVGQTRELAKLSKEQGSMIIEFLLQAEKGG